MKRSLSCLTLCILLLTTLSSRPALAKQTHNTASYFSFLENYIIAYTAIDTYNKQVLAAHTQEPTTQPVQQQPIQTAPQVSDISSYILNGVNEYRVSFGLDPVQSSTQTCAF